MWSKLIEVPVGIIAKEFYDLNHCAYHNWQHILDCYKYLEMEQIEYDEDLDFAVMHHDIVYDDKPEKELRSAELMLNWYPAQTAAYDIIMSTADHKTVDRDWKSIEMIKADLHQLAVPAMALENYVKIMRESTQLYQINEREFAKNNISFMNNLQVTAFENYDNEGDTVFWNSVIRGIELTISVSRELEKSLTSVDLYSSLYTTNNQ